MTPPVLVQSEEDGTELMTDAAFSSGDCSETRVSSSSPPKIFSTDESPLTGIYGENQHRARMCEVHCGLTQI